MTHNIEIRTVESMVILNALKNYTKETTNKIDVATAWNIYKRIADTVSDDLKTLRKEHENA